jgi:hypothetical protein
MERISQLEGVSRADLASFNRCRLYLGVNFLSEISSADGRALSRDAWNGSRTRLTSLLWPYQPSPGPISWRAWRRLLARGFLFTIPKRATRQTSDLSLDSPLGDWLHDSHWFHQKFSYFHSSSTGLIYH